MGYYRHTRRIVKDYARQVDESHARNEKATAINYLKFHKIMSIKTTNKLGIPDNVTMFLERVSLIARQAKL